MKKTNSAALPRGTWCPCKACQQLQSTHSPLRDTRCISKTARVGYRETSAFRQTRSRSALRMLGLSGPPIPCTRTADLAVASPSNRMAHPVTSTVFAHSIALGKAPAGTLSAKQFREVRTCHHQGQVVVDAFLLALTSAPLANMDTCGLRRTNSRTRTASTTPQCLRMESHSSHFHLSLLYSRTARCLRHCCTHIDLSWA
jgi:hypothetical protein